jgi:hypothetical protein
LKKIFLVFLIAGSALAWTCPACGHENQDEFCTECGLPIPPDGMEFIPACTVSIDGDSVSVPAFFIDSNPVICRDVLNWLSGEISYLDQIPVYLTGQSEMLMPGENIGEEFRDVVFIRYTPWVVYRNAQGQVTSVTVQTGCFDYPAPAFTFDAARLYLQDIGKRLPTRAEFIAAVQAGAIGYTDTWEVLSTYSDFISMTISSIVGVSPAGFSMFTENITPSERIMWEWTMDAWGQPVGEQPELQSPYALLMKPLDPIETGTCLRENGYFNVIYRGVVTLPWYGRS